MCVLLHNAVWNLCTQHFYLKDVSSVQLSITVLTGRSVTLLNCPLYSKVRHIPCRRPEPDACHLSFSWEWGSLLWKGKACYFSCLHFCPSVCGRGDPAGHVWALVTTAVLRQKERTTRSYLIGSKPCMSNRTIPVETHKSKMRFGLLFFLNIWPVLVPVYSWFR